MRVLRFESKLIPGPELAGTLMTPAEFDALEDWDETWRYELIHGVLVVTPPPLEAEADPNDELGYLLRHYQEHHPKGKQLDATLPERIIRTKKNRRRADRVIWTGLGRLPDPRLDLPTIAVEFVSGAKKDRRRDYVEKRKEYVALKIAEYWIIDRFRRVMTVVRNAPGGSREIVVKEDEVYRTPLLPGFELPLARLLTAANRWAAPD